MKQYVIIAKDGSDDAATERRMATRPSHLAGVSELKNQNHYVLGGAILDENERMTGSVMVVQFETDEQLKNWYDNEPYVKENVWQAVEIRPFRVANV